MIHLTNFFAISLPVYPKDSTTVSFSDTLDSFIEDAGGWENLLQEISNNRTPTVLYLDLPDLVTFLSVFVRSLYPESESKDRYGVVLRFLDQHLVGSLYFRKPIGVGLDLELVKKEVEQAKIFTVPEEITGVLAFEFLLADYFTRGSMTSVFEDRVKEIAYENFTLHLTIIFDSIFEGNFEPVFIDIPSLQDKFMDLMRDPEVPLFFSKEIDLERVVSHVLKNYSKGYLEELAVRTLALRAPKQVGVYSNTEFVRMLYGERYDQIKNEDWVGFINSELGLFYAIFFSKTSSYWKFSKRVIDFIKGEKPNLRLV